MPSRKLSKNAVGGSSQDLKLGQVLILDNGGSEIKFGPSTSTSAQVIPNAVIRSKGDKKTYIGDEIEGCIDLGGLIYRLPIERGFIGDWTTQKVIWDRCAFHRTKIDIKSSTLLLTEPCFNLPNIQQVYDEVVFEEYGFANYLRAPAPLYSSFIDLDEAFSGRSSSKIYDCVLVIDVGFSFTHVVPIYKGQVIWSAVKRIDVGGKLLTNHLKELISFRQWYMMDQTWIMNKVKESICYTSQDFDQDLEVVQANLRSNDIVREYVLPDFSDKNRHGKVRRPASPSQQPEGDEDEQVLTMGNERFNVPEVLLHPSLIGLDQAGLAETIAITISLVPEHLQGLFWANMVLTGGSSQFSGFKARLEKDLLTFRPDQYTMRMYQSESPNLTAWMGARNLAQNHEDRLKEMVVTKAEYEEYGFQICRTRFGETNDRIWD